VRGLSPGEDRPREGAVATTIKHGERYLQVQATSVFNGEHEVEAIVEFYRDVTLEKTYERQIQQADKLAALGQLVSGIGHEINNPNQFIRGNIKIVRQGLEDMLPIIDAHYRDHPDLRIARLKYDFYRKHVLTLMDDMAHGSDRIKQIVDALRASCATTRAAPRPGGDQHAGGGHGPARPQRGREARRHLPRPRRGHPRVPGNSRRSSRSS